jgi:putative ABC transport system ATP-binding protein
LTDRSPPVAAAAVARDEAAPVLSLRGVAKTFGGESRQTVLRDVGLDLRAGEYVAIMGESGAGKSTLLNLIAGLDRPDAGTIALDGVDIGALDDDAATLLRREKIGFIFQAFHVLPNLSVAQNVALPLALLGASRGERQTRVLAALQAVGLTGRAQRYPRELSGGELQRVSVARALVHQPRLLLADEPTGNLDRDNADAVLALIRARIDIERTAAILVTHSERAAATADRVLMLGVQGLTPARLRAPDGVHD